MHLSTRFLTGGLATAAIASAVTLTAPGAYAADGPTPPCDQPAVPAVFLTVIHEPQLRAVPAVTHDEWRWQREVTTYEYAYAKTVRPAYDETDWTRDVPLEFRWTRTVVTQKAVPAVPGTAEVSHFETVVITPAVTVVQYEYRQKEHPTQTRWEDEGWNADKEGGDRGQGWERTGNTRELTTPAVTEQVKVVTEPAHDGTPAVPEISHVEEAWAATSPGDDWTRDLATPAQGGGTESVTTTGDDQPAGDGWQKVATRHVDASVDTQWAQSAPDGYDATGESRVLDVTTEQTDDTSATAPEGEGWTIVPDSLVVKVDVPETTELVGPGFTEEVLVSPAIPAGAPCPEVSGGGVSAPTDAATGGGATAVSGAQAAAASPAAAGSASSTVLPATGNPVSPLLLTTGLGALVAGSLLVRVGRRRRTH